jgi:hypothetical protein
MVRRLYILMLATLLAAPAAAAEQRPRLVQGGADLFQGERLRLAGGEVRTEVLSKGALSVGAVVDAGQTASPGIGLPFDGGRDRLALGGYVGYAFRGTYLSSSLKNSGTTTSADLSAAYAGGLLGLDGVTSLKLGADWTRPSSFSPNPSQANPASLDASRLGGDVNLSVSLMHDVTPSFSLGGVAAASRPTTPDAPPAGFMLGAGVGYRF